MTQERLAIEQTVLEQYHLGKYMIEIGDGGYTLKYTYRESQYYSIVTPVDYPATPPEVRLDYLAVNASTSYPSSESLSKLPEIIKKPDGLYLCYDSANNYDPTWSFYKIIGLVNDWIDKNDNAGPEAAVDSSTH